jgi:DNA-binding CsgD family transcriptional regulator
MGSKARGARPEKAAVEFEVPPELVAYQCDEALEDFILLEYRPGAAVAAAELTGAEREVLDLLLRGLSNAELAASRHRSSTTVAKQVASLLAKHGVHGRSELFALLAHPRKAR